MSTVVRTNTYPSNNDCPITREPILQSLTTRCHHIFERAALVHWLQINDICPICMTVRPISTTPAPEATKKSIRAQRDFYFDGKPTRRRRQM